MQPADRADAAADDLARAGARDAPVEIVEYDSASQRTHHLHLVDEPEELERRLRFRDRLRTDPVLAGEYVSLKQTLAERHRHDREAYTEAKSEFIRPHDRPRSARAPAT